MGHKNRHSVGGSVIFMLRRAILMIAFPRVKTIYIYIIIFLCHLRKYELYTQLRKLQHSGGISQLMCVARNRTFD